jgi:hypothetical protein
MKTKACVLWLALLFNVASCKNENPDAVPPEPVEECKQYEALIASCFHRETAFASHESLIPKTKSDRERIRQLCSENLQRLTTACH